jgi:translation initiation factor 3 subunit E
MDARGGAGGSRFARETHLLVVLSLLTHSLTDRLIHHHHHHHQVPEHLKKRKEEVLATLAELKEKVTPIVNFLSKAENVKLLKSDRAHNLSFLQNEFQIGPAHVDALFSFAKWMFECGNYNAAHEYLYHYRTLSSHPEKNTSALWGRIASSILLQDFQSALDDVVKLKELLENDTFAPVQRQLQQKSWLMHWSLFVFFNHENGMSGLVDLFTQDRYLTAIQLCAPHLLRYLVVAVLVSKRRTRLLKDLVRVISQEKYEYSDPITEFVRCLFVDYDFEGAQEKLEQCGAVLDGDFFLVAKKEAFIEAAREQLFSQYCAIHKCIEMEALSKQLGMQKDDTERWLVNLIRGSRLQASIDSGNGTIKITNQGMSSYDQLLEKARGLSLRTFSLANQVVASTKS